MTARRRKTRSSRLLPLPCVFPVSPGPSWMFRKCTKRSQFLHTRHFTYLPSTLPDQHQHLHSAIPLLQVRTPFISPQLNFIVILSAMYAILPARFFRSFGVNPSELTSQRLNTITKREKLDRPEPVSSRVGLDPSRPYCTKVRTDGYDVLSLHRSFLCVPHLQIISLCSK